MEPLKYEICNREYDIKPYFEIVITGDIGDEDIVSCISEIEKHLFRDVIDNYRFFIHVLKLTGNVFDEETVSRVISNLIPGHKVSKLIQDEKLYIEETGLFEGFKIPLNSQGQYSHKITKEELYYYDSYGVKRDVLVIEMTDEEVLDFLDKSFESIKNNLLEWRGL